MNFQRTVNRVLTVCLSPGDNPKAFWNCLKRAIGGTYVSVEPYHLYRYVDEQAFRYNTRKDENDEPLTDAQRFTIGMRQIVGKRLTYAELTGKVETPESAMRPA